MKKRLILIAIILVVGGYFWGREELDTAAILPQVPDTGEVLVTEISVAPSTIQQGEPALITVFGTSTVERLTWNGKSLTLFEYKDRQSALLGIDLNLNPGTYPLVATLSSGKTLRKDLMVGRRDIVEAPLGIPDQLGGNTPEAEQNLLANLARENALLNSVETAPEALWEDEFRFPLRDPIVTDDYGYNRLTGASTIPHKGTDFRAAVGTPTYAMNDGVVRLAREFIVYGNTVVIDHGAGVQSMYMHLSRLDVEEGQEIDRGDRIGLSGKTGYAEFAHLHLSIKIHGVSIDPIKFIELFNR